MKQRGAFSLLALSTIGSLAVATGSVLMLGPEDKISVPRGFFISILGFIFFLSLFDFINHVGLKTNSGIKIRKKYQLTISDVLDISNKIVSAVQAALSCITGVIVCLWSCTRDFLHSSHFMSEAYAWFGAAYFFYDIWSMYKVHINTNHPRTSIHKNEKSLRKPSKIIYSDKNANTNAKLITDDRNNVINDTESFQNQDMMIIKQKDGGSLSFFTYCKEQPIIIMHHLFIGGFGFMVVVYLRGGLGDCVFGFVYLMELSTPFVSLRSILSRLKMKSSQLYVVNGVLMLVSFFVCRIMVMPYLCLLYSQNVGLPYWQAIGILPTGCKISISILLFPQFYWFYLMVIGATKVFCAPKVKDKSSILNQAATQPPKSVKLNKSKEVNKRINGGQQNS